MFRRSVVVHPCAPTGAQPGNRLWLWVGLLARTGPPDELVWRLDGELAAPTPVRALASARPVPTMASPQTRRAFTGVYEFAQGITPDTVYSVQAGAVEDGRTVWGETRRVRTLPDRVSSDLDESFNVLAVSCYHSHEDPIGAAGIVVDQLPAMGKPHLTILLGDQVYLDLPLLRQRPRDEAVLAGQFERDYVTNWAGSAGYSRVLNAAPSTALPDDHEYWNNYPHPATLVPATWSPSGRRTWQRAARAMYDAFQIGEPDAYERWLDVPPLSFLLLDNRTFRAEDRSASARPKGLALMEEWAAHVVAHRRVGVVVTGQSLFQEPAGPLKARLADRHLANYRDYPAMMGMLSDLVARGRPVLCLTGDVHYGRMIAARTDASPTNPLYEVITSPSSLVTTLPTGPRSEQNPWPRHSPPKRPPQVLRPGRGSRTWRCEMLGGVRGDHVALLAFRRRGPGVQLVSTFWFTRGGERRRFAPVKLG